MLVDDKFFDSYNVLKIKEGGRQMERYFDYIKNWIRIKSVTDKQEICKALMERFKISKDEADKALNYYILGRI